MLPAKKIRAFAAKLSENIAAGILAAMFFTFLLQIFSRYVLANPLGWTLELCLTLWVWLVFFGAGFVVRHQDHVAFDMFYNAAPQKLRRFFALAGAAAIAASMAAAFLPTWDYIDFLKIKKSATLGVKMRSVFSVYALFMLAVIAAYAARFVFIIRHKHTPEESETPPHQMQPPADKIFGSTVVQSKTAAQEDTTQK